MTARKLGHSYLDELYEPRPPYVPYQPDGWLLAGEIVSQVAFFIGLVGGILLALAGYNPVAPVTVMVLGLLLAGVVYVAEEDR